MQWSAFFAMPLAVGIAKGREQWISLVETFRTLFYWWSPDAAFLHLDASTLGMPQHKRREWEAGQYRTGFPQTSVVKVVSGHLAAVAPRAARFLEKFRMDLEDIQSLLLDVQEGATPQAAACNWVRSKRSLWTDWIPVDTQCLPGEGLQSATGDYLTERSAAVGCSTCRPGNFSAQILDDKGHTYACKPCRAGTFESGFGKTACVDCEVGTFSSRSGRAHCDRCELGRYANATGMTSCQACGEHWSTSQLVVSEGVETWVQVDGATSESLCVCVEGRPLVTNFSEKLVACVRGLYMAARAARTLNPKP